MKQAKAPHSPEKRPRILLIYRKMIPSIRLCGHCQMEYLSKQKKVEYRAIQELKLKKSDLNWADIVLLGRLDSWYECRLAKKLHEAGRYLIYIIDDDLLNVPPEISSASYYNQPCIQKNILTMIELSDAILSPSPILLRKYAVDGKHAIQIEEPAIEPVSYKPHNLNGPVKIGFAGSIDREYDVENILKEALLCISRKYSSDVKFEFYGGCLNFAAKMNASYIPYSQSYLEYRRKLNGLNWDIGLAPIPSTDFHSCKHYNKYIEYAAAGILCVCSDLQPYARLKSMVNSELFAANTTESWVSRLEKLIDDPVYREHMRKEAIYHAHYEFNIHQIAEALEAELRQKIVHKNKNRRKVACHLLFLKAGGCGVRAVWGAKKYGTKLSTLNKKKAGKERVQ